MLHLELTADQGHIKFTFQVPDKPGETIRLDELATFGLHLDVVKKYVVEMMAKGIAQTDGVDIAVE